MYKYVLKRLLLMIPILLGVSLIGYFLLYISPGDAVDAIAAQGGSYTEEQKDAMREELGLNDPFFIQYLNYLKGIVFHFDFGTSYTTNRSVTSEILTAFPTTLLLSCLGILVAVMVGIPAGIISATKQYSIFDKIVTPISLIGVSMPGFWFGLLLIIAFSVNLKLLPASGFYGPKYWILPAVTVGAMSAAFIMRMTRSSMLECIRQDYIRTARAKGQTEFKIVMRHALRNAMLPIITATGLQFGYLLGGSILAESVFAIPGLGKLILDGIKARNYPVVEGGVLFFAFAFSIVNLMVDVLYAYVDPRIKSQYVRKKDGHDE